MELRAERAPAFTVREAAIFFSSRRSCGANFRLVADTHSQFFSPVLTDPGVNLRRHYVSKNLVERLFHHL
jgi:hypothetical protein